MDCLVPPRLNVYWGGSNITRCHWTSLHWRHVMPWRMKRKYFISVPRINGLSYNIIGDGVSLDIGLIFMPVDFLVFMCMSRVSNSSEMILIIFCRSMAAVGCFFSRWIFSVGRQTSLSIGPVYGRLYRAPLSAPIGAARGATMSRLPRQRRPIE